MTFSTIDIETIPLFEMTVALSYIVYCIRYNV